MTPGLTLAGVEMGIVRALRFTHESKSTKRRTTNGNRRRSIRGVTDGVDRDLVNQKGVLTGALFGRCDKTPEDTPNVL